MYGNGIVTSEAENYPVQAEVQVVDEHRTVPRRRLLKAGKISFGGGCCFRLHDPQSFRNRRRARGDLPVGIPERFTLVVEADHRHLPCRVVWRKEKRIGVHFET
jgi:hypothetical protein